MDMPANKEIRDLASTSLQSDGPSLVNASRQAHQRNYQDFLIVDVDAHHYESESYKEVFEYISSPVVKQIALESRCTAAAAPRSWAAASAIRILSGRITRHWLRKQGEDRIRTSHRDIVKTTLAGWTRWASTTACLFPTPMLFLGTHPQAEIEAELAMAYNRWLCERILAA